MEHIFSVSPPMVRPFTCTIWVLPLLLSRSTLNGCLLCSHIASPYDSVTTSRSLLCAVECRLGRDKCTSSLGIAPLYFTLLTKLQCALISSSNLYSFLQCTVLYSPFLSYPSSLSFISVLRLYSSFLFFISVLHFYSSFLFFISILHLYSSFLFFISVLHFYSSFLSFICILHFYSSFLFFICILHFYSSFVFFISVCSSCYQLLRDIKDMGGEDHGTIRVSVLEQMADAHLARVDDFTIQGIACYIASHRVAVH
jgi:hypothetical protein